VWNQWRREMPHVQPDLRQANLHAAQLFGPDVDPSLSHVNLQEAILFNVDLSRADLRRANLRDADLRGANLSRANLQEASLNSALLMDADLHAANLSGALLMEANLNGVNLYAADLTEADLSGATLSKATLNDTHLVRATLRQTFLRGASLVRADLSNAFLSDVDLGATNLSQANFSDANLRGAFIREANLSGANLTGANLRYSRFIEVDLENANIANCAIYGISAWNLKLDGTDQSNLIITRPDEPTITVDNIEVGQFIYLLLNNQKIRTVIDTITSKAVLILGRFTPERKSVLDALREELRRHDYLPILLDFDKPSSRNLTETISTLAHIARFVIADITDAKSIPQELQRIIPSLPSLPVQPLLLSTEYEYGMFKDLLDYPWILEPYQYDSLEELLASLDKKVIAPAVTKARELEQRRKALEEETKRH
jgi:uncharacterized protein YjbI with pentapeptide repeats